MTSRWRHACLFAWRTRASKSRRRCAVFVSSSIRKKRVATALLPPPSEKESWYSFIAARRRAGNSTYYRSAWFDTLLTSSLWSDSTCGQSHGCYRKSRDVTGSHGQSRMPQDRVRASRRYWISVLSLKLTFNANISHDFEMSFTGFWAFHGVIMNSWRGVSVLSVCACY